LGDILNRVALRHDQFVIERKGEPLAAMIPVEKLERIERVAREHLLDLLKRQPGRALPERQATRLADEAKHASRVSRGGTPKRRRR
jgi:hypothetical protein